MTDIAPITSNTTSELISLALNAATMRHTAIAQNIANVNTEGYRPLQVDFDRQVALFKDQLLSSGNDASTSRAIRSLNSSIKMSEVEENDASKVQLDVEIAKMTQNAIHYQALLTAKGKMSSFLRMAISGGR